MMNVSFLSGSIERMSKIRDFVLAHKRVAVGAVLLLVAASVYALVSQRGGEQEVFVVEPKPFLQQIAVSGKVEAADSVAMTFERTGRIMRVYADVGDTVAQGDALVALDSASLSAQIAAAEADVARRRLERANQGVNLEEVTRQQDTKVESAYRTLLTTGLVATPGSSTYTAAPPLISGLYKGGVEGSYKLRIERAANPSDHTLRVQGIEDATTVKISETAPTQVGSYGLYVSFPDDLTQYRDTTWYVNIPNVKGASYPANYNAYQEALRERTRAIEDAQSELATRGQGSTIADAALAAAVAEVARLRAELSMHTLRAPFDGTVTRVDVVVGDTASQTTPAVTVMSAGELEIESYVPEINISYLEVGDPAVVTLDAYGETIPFPARVVSIDPAETIRDGVSTYRVKLHFNEPDERVRSGMTANIVITTDEREGVLSVPQGAVTRRGGTSFVMVALPDGQEERREVSLGPVSSLGEVEIIAGLSAGEAIVVPGS